MQSLFAGKSRGSKNTVAVSYHSAGFNVNCDRKITDLKYIYCVFVLFALMRMYLCIL